MPHPEKPKFPTMACIAWITGIACVACCTVPVIGVAIGSASLVALARYSEQAAFVIAMIGLGVLVLKRLMRKSGPACDIDGACRPKSVGANLPDQGK